MAYTVAPTQPVSGSTLVQLDSGAYVLLAVHARVLHGTGALHVSGTATAVDGAGAPVLDANGHEATSGFGQTLTPAQATDAAAVQAAIKDVSLVLLGEPPVSADLSSSPDIGSASIRNAIASAAHAGPVTNLGSIL
ncbi:MAG: hypothetical protein KGL35_32000 [Bradyrhizobium sp.]|nr:hypothetical protein [Bradyrhizobium sp.]